MSSNVFLAPCDAGNFDRTILSEVDLNQYPAPPEEFSGMDTVRFWGVREGSRNENNFEQMDSGDLVLFYQSGSYIGTGWIGITFKDDEQWASSTFWNDAPSRLLYTITEFTPVSVPKAAVNRIFDYDEEYNPQGLIRIAEKNLDNRPAAIKRALSKYTEKHR